MKYQNSRMVSNQPRKTKIFVGRLPENCRSDELRQIFVHYGEVTECDVMNRYAFVHMAREEDAISAIKALHNTQFKGATINVEHSTGKTRGPRRDDRRNGPMRSIRGGRDNRQGPYNDRRVLPIPNSSYEGNSNSGGGQFSDYNRMSGNFDGRNDTRSGYNDRGGYEANIGGTPLAGNYQGNPIMSGYGVNNGSMGGGYGHSNAGIDYNRSDYGGNREFGGRTDYGSSAGIGDFNRPVAGHVDYGRTDNFIPSRNDGYPRTEYDRLAPGLLRNGNNGSLSGANYPTNYNDIGPVASSNYGPTYSTAMGPQGGDMFSRRVGGTVGPINSNYQVGRFSGQMDPMPPRY